MPTDTVEQSRYDPAFTFKSTDESCVTESRPLLDWRYPGGWI
jgi:hypothetical protein